MEKTIKIVVATHKECKIPKDDLYLPIQVGKALHLDKDFSYQPDNEGENISEKNPYYSELTALYWAWKNLDADYIGLAHYRRHFRLKRKWGDWNSILTRKEAELLCKNFDIILPKKRQLFIETIYSHYDHTFDGQHLDATRQIIGEECPEYISYFDRVMNRKSAHFFNMVIMKREVLNNYCNWLFPLLEKLESHYNLKTMDAFQARLIGRVSERLLDVWIEKNKFSYKEIGYIYFGKKNYHKKVIGFIKAKFFRKKYKKSFCL